MKRVSIFPPWEPWLGNRMFEAAEGCVYSPSLRRWRELAAHSGFQLDTSDICPPSEADVVWFMDLPRTKRVVDEVRRSARAGTPFVLQILESPLLFPAAFVEANRRSFDAIVSFEFARDEGGHFTYKLPVEMEPRYEGLPFAERKFAVMVNTNRVEGWLATRKPGWTGLPGAGGYFSGWKMPPWHFMRPASGELYSWRRRLARLAGKSKPDQLDIFGPGWQGETVSWFPFGHSHIYRCHRPDVVERDQENAKANKRARLSNYRFVIAAENLRAQRGYISEKIFDAMLGGSVPVYVGEQTITENVPAEAFIDATQFGSVRDLWRYLEAVSEKEWQVMREAGQEYLASEAFQAFTGEAFANRMMEILRRVAAREG
jgi:hypothetical protein